MGSEIGIGKRHPNLPDAELLRRIAQDMRSLYADVIKRPLPRDIAVALSRIDREQIRGSGSGTTARSLKLQVTA